LTASPEDPILPADPQWQLVSDDLPGAPLPGLSDDWLDRFRDGDASFDLLFRESQGLGPVYIRAACSSCHGSDGRGPGEVQKMVLVDGDGAPLPDQGALLWGHTVRPYVAGGAMTPLLPPDDRAVAIGVRAPPPVFGRGYVDAVDDAEILRGAGEQEAAGVVRGRPNRVPYQSVPDPADEFHAVAQGDLLIGRFGLKGRIATADDFAADAFQGDMSLTSPLRPDELPNPDGLADDALPGPDLSTERVQRVAGYLRLLAMPPRPDDPVGAGLFADAGCAECHVPSLRTRADYPVPPLADVDAPLYSDLLLHDMGADLGDGLTDYDAGPTDWKTPPLMGLRFQPTYLHDGRAASVLDAIEAHGAPDSEAAPSVDRFHALSDADRARLVAFVEAL
jgi:CxxC motif-containing protein (DUF1111 family)